MIPAFTSHRKSLGQYLQRDSSPSDELFGKDTLQKFPSGAKTYGEEEARTFQGWDPCPFFGSHQKDLQ